MYNHPTHDEIERLTNDSLLDKMNKFINEVKSNNIKSYVLKYQGKNVGIFIKPSDRWYLIEIAIDEVELKTGSDFSFYTEEICGGKYQFTNWYAFDKLTDLSISMLQLFDEISAEYNYDCDMPIKNCDKKLLIYLTRNFGDGKGYNWAFE